MRALTLLLMLVPVACGAAEIDYLQINLMQPRNLILQKVDGIEGMSKYVKEVELDIHKELSSIAAMPSWGYLVIAVREDGKIKAWLDTDDQIDSGIQNRMIEAAVTTPSFKVKTGAVIFALGFGINGADIPPNVMPFPEAWKSVSNCQGEDCKNENAEEIVLTSW